MMNDAATTLTGRNAEQGWAHELFKRAMFEGAVRRVWRGLRGRPVKLHWLSDAAAHSVRSLGHQTVAINTIIGSEGRAGDFDSCFAPLTDHTRDRWVSVAQARQRGRALPAVQLIRTSEGYYVRDGHHRISVARALGEEFVEAEVVAWE